LILLPYSVSNTHSMSVFFPRTNACMRAILRSNGKDLNSNSPSCSLHPKALKREALLVHSTKVSKSSFNINTYTQPYTVERPLGFGFICCFGYPEVNQEILQHILEKQAQGFALPPSSRSKCFRTNCSWIQMKSQIK